MSPRSELVGSWAFHRKRRGGTGGGGGGGAPLSFAYSESSGVRREAPRLHVLILGGASRAELRCALEAAGGGNVAFGTTEMLSPLEYVAALQEAGGGVEGLRRAGGGGGLEGDDDDEEEVVDSELQLGPAALRGLLQI